MAQSSALQLGKQRKNEIIGEGEDACGFPKIFGSNSLFYRNWPFCSPAALSAFTGLPLLAPLIF